MISVFLRIPAVARLSMARLVMVILYARIASGIPGTRLSTISSVASGMISLGENPVPPVVRISSAALLSAISFILSESICLSSGRMSMDTTSYPFFSTISRIAGPLKSSLSPRYPVSLDVMIATLFIYFSSASLSDSGQADKIIRFAIWLKPIISENHYRLQNGNLHSFHLFSLPNEYSSLPYVCQLLYTYHRWSEVSPEHLSGLPFPRLFFLLF